MRDLLKEIYESIRRNKLRTVLTGLAVSWGIFMLIVLLGAKNGIQNTSSNNMEGIVSNVMEIYSGYTSKPYAGFKQGRYIPIKDSDVLTTESNIFEDHIDDVIPLLSQSSLTMAYGKKHFSITMVGTTEDYARIEKLEILAGRFLNANDIKEKKKVAVIAHSHAKNFLYGDTDYDKLIGKKIKINNLIFTIVGVRHGRENEDDQDLYIPYSTLKAVFARNDEIDYLNFTFHGLETEEENEAFEAYYRSVLNKKHNAAPDDKRALGIYNYFTRNMQMNKGNRILNTALWIVGLFTLLGGIVGVSNIMLITVKERTHEFGIRKAIGAKPADITKLIIAESVAVTAVFGYIGMICGMLACEVMDATLGSSSLELFGESIQIMSNPSVGVDTAIGVTIVLIVAGTLAGLIPARKAAKVRPIEALSVN